MYNLFDKGFANRQASFKLPSAVVNESRFTLTQGYAFNSYICEETCIGKTFIQASVSEDLVLDLFWKLLEPLGS